MKIIVPSWMIPGTYLQNLRFIEDKKEITGVELLFFLYDDAIKKEFLDDISAVTQYKNRFTLSAHLPDSLCDNHRELVETLLPLVSHFIVHPARDINKINEEAEFLLSWFSAYGKEKFFIENTENYTGFNKLLDILPKDTNICMDTGHLLLACKPPLEFIKTYGTRIKEVHLHNTDKEAAKIDGKLADHRSVDSRDKWLCDIMPFLKTFNGFINLEVFSWKEASKSLEELYGKH